MANSSLERPLSDDEFVELGELLASFPEAYDPVEADYLDGFLTALLCLPQEPAPAEWMPFLFDRNGQHGAALTDEDAQDRLEELIYRRYRQIDRTLARAQPLDPIIYEIEDEKGRPVRGYDSIAAVIPFSLGFLEVIDRWTGLKDSDDPTISSALLGILRHLPDEIAGDIAEIKEELELESPLENLDQALEDIAMSVAEITSVTRGFPVAESAEKKAQHGARNHKNTTEGRHAERRRTSASRKGHARMGRHVHTGHRKN